MTIYERLVSAFTSDVCQYCRRAGSSVCGDCMTQIAPARASRCGLCNTITLEWRVCSSCRRKTALSRLIVAGDYRGELKDVLRQFKYERKRHLALPLATLLEPLIETQFDVVSFVPTAGSRRRRRGYDQAQLLAEELAKLLDVECKPLLLRVSSERQVGRSRAERLKLANRQFALGVEAAEIESKRILIVDDVVTTGATISAAANMLKPAKPKKIVGIAVAK